MSRTWNKRIGIRETVRQRSGGRCEICDVQLAYADQIADDHGSLHHRFQRCNGGKDTVRNLIHLCRRCHTDRIHANPSLALKMGWILLHPDEESCALMTRTGWAVIREDGSMSTLPWWRAAEFPSTYDDIDHVQTA